MRLHLARLLIALSILAPPARAEGLRAALRDLRGRQEAVVNLYAGEAAEALTNVYQFGVLGGAAVTAGAYAHRLVRWYQNRGVDVDPADLTTFFTLPEDEQYALARKHPQFAAALIELDERVAREPSF